MLSSLCNEIGVDVPQIVEDDGDVVVRTRQLARLREGSVKKHAV